MFRCAVMYVGGPTYGPFWAPFDSFQEYIVHVKIYSFSTYWRAYVCQNPMTLLLLAII